MARTPDVAGALEAVVARTLKSTMGPRLRKLDSQMRRLDKKLKKIAARRGAARKGRPRGRRKGSMRARRRGGRARR
jgi:hypothetical protein